MSESSEVKNNYIIPIDSNISNKIEIDEPIDNKDNTNALDINNEKDDINFNDNRDTETLNNDKAIWLENQANYVDRMEKHWFKKYGLNLMIGCGIVYIALVIFDTITYNIWEWKASELMTGLIELLKFVVSTLIGFVFSENLKNK